MITTIIICVTVIIVVALILKWAKDMSAAGLPMFTYGECIQKSEEDNPKVVPAPVGFQADVTPESKHKDETQMSDVERMNAILQDSASTISALLRGEVDFDDIKQ